ncbi:MAG TPA: AMP-binding protein [Candidatus Limnocylindria bacterium]|nr:AMP-binding protein [Candidatus Limnocylindria bacterium]
MAAAWTPSFAYLERSRLRAFAMKNGCSDYAALLRWSTEDLAGFWAATERDLHISWRTPYTNVLDTARGIQWATWWTGGRMNYVATALQHADTDGADRVAIVAESEEGTVRTLTYRELSDQVASLAAGLRSLGVKRGDRVAVFLPLTVECAVAVLAIGAIAAVVIPIFSGYGAEAIAGRLRDAEAKVLICADGFYRRGKVVNMKETADEAADGAPSVDAVVVVDRVGRAYPKRGRDVAWSDVTHAGALLDIADTAAEDPFMVIYTSGTTGKPKGAQHVHGGFPVKAAQDLAHCFDLQERDVILWSTDIGWMMGPWLIAGGLMLGATIVLYDGTPDFPDASRMWSLVERHKVTHLGISPTAIRGLMRSGEDPVRAKDRSSLFVLGSTGEPWNPDPWWWYFRTVGESRCPIINYSGGTEISGGILGCTTWTPIQPSSFSGPCPGMDADVVDEKGRSVRRAVGELVIRKPWPGMTRGFWGDQPTEQGRYFQTYWSRLPNTWVHGDWARIDDDGYWYIEGRSDDTLKIAGKRVGPAEVESAAVAHPAVSEAAAIGIPHEIKGEAIVVFVVPRPLHHPTDELARSVQDKIAEILGKPLRPEAVRFVTELPKTRNAKILRRVIRGAYLGKTDLGDLTSLENPTAIAEIRALPRT